MKRTLEPLHLDQRGLTLTEMTVTVMVMGIALAESALLATLEEEGIGCIVFSPLEQGVLTDRYLDGIPDDSRAAKAHGYLHREEITDERVAKVRRLSEMARQRGQSLAQMAIAWVLRHSAVTSALIGASRVEQIEDCVASLENLSFTEDELGEIDRILSE